MPDLDGARVVVAGDVMIDRYWHGATARISPEAPVPVVRIDQSEERPGGAANVALNLAALGARPVLHGLVGDDHEADDLQGRLEAAGVICRLQRVPGAATIAKLRVISQGQQLIRLDAEKPFPLEAAHALGRQLIGELAAGDVVIASDYAKGALSAVAEIIAAARSRGVATLVDPKGRGFERYRGASVLTPNLKEFEAEVGFCADADTLARHAVAQARACDIGAMLVTRGEHGMSLLRPGQRALHLPTRAREVFDVTGAGDTVIAVLGAMLAAREPLAAATWYANVAAGCVVGKIGTAVVTPAELREAVQGAGRPDEDTFAGEREADAACEPATAAREAG